MPWASEAKVPPIYCACVWAGHVTIVVALSLDWTWNVGVGHGA